MSASGDKRRKNLAALLLGLIPGVVGILLLHIPLFETLERTGLDLLFLIRGVRQPPPGVCVVVLDDDSRQALGIPLSAAWPRSLYARLVRTLTAEGARAIAFDVSMPDEGGAAGDGDLAKAIVESGRVVLGKEINLEAGPHGPVVQEIDPYEPLARAAAKVAPVNLRRDRDDVVRETYLRFEEPGEPEMPSLALAAYQVGTGDRSPQSSLFRFIDYYGPARTMPTVSIYQAIEPGRYLHPGTFRDCIVFVGQSEPTGPGKAAKDTFSTPFRSSLSQQTDGVEIHATIAANLLEGRRFDLLPWFVEGLLILALPLVTTFVFIHLRPVLGALALVFLALVPWISGHVAFAYGGLWLPVMIPSVVQVPGAYVLSLIWYYLTTVKERERIRRAFSFYLSPDMIARIIADPASLNLGGEEITGTALFTDIQGFTTLSESMGAKEIASLLNRYFSEVNRQIFAEGGTLIKFIGDAVFAIWGAPVRMEDHATRACAAALALARAEAARVGDGGSALKSLVTRIGVNTGYMMVGNLGSEQRFDYTAIGDAVNVASRLEGLNKFMRTQVIASGRTIFLTSGAFVARRLGLARVAGREEPVEFFEILGRQGEATVPQAEALARFETAVGDYTAGRLEQAAEGFREVMATCGGEDGPSEFYLRTIERYRNAPPEGGWDGVLPFEGK